MKINFTLLAKKIIALAKSFSVTGPATEKVSCCYPACPDNFGELVEGTININKQYHNDPLTTGSFSFLYNTLRPELVYPELNRREGQTNLIAIAGGQSDILLKKNNKSTHNSLVTLSTELACPAMAVVEVSKGITLNF